MTGSTDQTAIVWNVNKRLKLYILKSHSSIISSVAISNDDTKVVTGSNDKTAIVWDINTGQKL